MEDVSEYFKNGFQGLYKTTIGKKYQQKTVRDRVSNFNNMRRETRSTLAFQRRQIDENMTPSNTPEPSKVNKQVVGKEEIKKPNKRFEMLHKWKIEKEKRKQEEKLKGKPVFKVCRVPEDLGLPNLQNINKNIKGKPIKSIISQGQSQFAPPNHKFQAPKTVKPIQLNYVGNKLPIKPNTFERNMRSTPRSQQLESLNEIENKNHKRNLRPTNIGQKAISKIENKNVKSGTKETTRPDIKVENKNGNISGTTRKQNIGKTNRSSKTVTKKQLADLNTKDKESALANLRDRKGKNLSNIKKHPNENKFIDIETDKMETGTKEHSRVDKRISRKSAVKAVGWNSVEIVRDQISSLDVDIKTPKTIKKVYVKTPKKVPKFNESDVELIDERNSSDMKHSNSEGLPTKNVNKTKRQLRKSSSNTELRELDRDLNTHFLMSQNSTIGSATGSASPDYPIDKNSTESNSSFRTPQKKNCEESPVYISPFVTVSRGKTSARKEYQIRRSAGEGTSEFNIDILNSTSPKAGADYFLRKLNNEVNRIEDICDMWICYKNSNEIPEEASDLISVAIGQSKLLISKKFEQFRNLIEQCRKCEYVGKPITCDDLHGFWDMIYMQVGDLNKRFNNLNALKANNWQEIIPIKKAVVKRGRGRPKKASASETLKNLIRAARDKKLNSEGGINLTVPQTDETKEFDGGYYSVKSPVRTLIDEHVTSGSARRSLRVSLLHQLKNRVSSPGLTMMKVSQAIKYGDGITPSKSILKNDLSKSAKGITKSVLFKDSLEEDMETKLITRGQQSNDKDVDDDVNKENIANEINLISFSPATPVRRSKRLTKTK